MRSIGKKLISAAVGVFTALTLSAAAFADYTYSFDDRTLIPELIADTSEPDGTSIVLERELGDSSDDGITIRFALFNEYLDPEVWNTDDITVSCEVKLETEGKDVIAYIPAFNTKWNWINPSEFTKLKYNEWVTITEKGTHFYPDFSKAAPNQLLFQVRANWGAAAQGKVKVTLRNFSINGTPVSAEATTTESSTTSATTTTAATTTETTASTSDTEPVESDTEPVESDTEPVESDTEPVESDTEPVESDTEPVESDTEPVESVSEPVESNSEAAATTTIQTAAAATTASSIDYSALLERPDENIGGMIAIVVISVVAVAALVIVGYIIYKKKKYY